eukprot:Plantae.Rhodophyta-Purpureofilum_apyrenoidigerum.ctg16738.p1 GENE.Plantae.Rhodophyta-Purpureofilum_apyrenoidigerum.ctg16738~~Plantae.Rhodophyta-Purpureofilum_apyrenoidigerum.ctg16738.p1  ORF type:complete len:337 (+),score=45.53 Plantae.Rhodophyta-Purpureofilum_apyrenoidigerum.ctg16738:47-1057(+)
MAIMTRGAVRAAILGSFLSLFLAGSALAQGTCEEGEQVSTFVLGFIGHSGSTAIMSTLMQHENLFVPSNTEPLLAQAGNALESVKKSRQLFNQYRGKFGNSKAPGFKVRPSNIFTSGGVGRWQKLINKFNTRLILNYRENIFKSSIGMYSIRGLGDLSSQMGLPDGKTSEEHCKENPHLCSFRIDDFKLFSNLLFKAMDSKRRTLEIAEKLCWPCVHYIRYEDFEKDSNGEMDKVYDFLGVPREQHTALFQKALPKSPCKILSNYQEVCSRFWGCEQFRPYLEDPENDCYCDYKPEEPMDPLLCNRKAAYGFDEELCTVMIQGAPMMVSCASLNNN